MNLIRQDLRWENDIASLPVASDINTDEASKTRIIRDLAGRLELNANISETIQGHLVMQLYRCAGYINDKNKINFDPELLKNYIRDPDENGKPRYQFSEILPILLECIDDFYKMCLDQGVVTKEPEKKGKMFDTDDIPKTESTAGNQTDTELQDFRIDMQTLVSVLFRLKDKLIPGLDRTLSNLSVGELFRKYQEKQILDFPDTENVAFTQTLSEFYQLGTESSRFNLYLELFKKDQITIRNLFDKLFAYFTRQTLANHFQIISLTENSITDTAPAACFQLRFSLSGPGSDYDLLVNYTYINGPVSITDDQISQSIRLLDDHILLMGTGCYYTYIIFYNSHTGFNAIEEEVNANYQLETRRPDLRGKISFQIISIVSFDLLDTNIGKLKAGIISYKPKPVSTKPKNFTKKKRPAVNADPVSSGASFVDPDDPRKGNFGGEPIRNNRKLDALVTPDTDSGGWYSIRLWVESITPGAPLDGKVTFYLHPTFSPDGVTVIAEKGIAEIKDLPSYEAFTVGATCDNNSTKLELDLNTLPNLPEGFGYEVETTKAVKKK